MPNNDHEDHRENEATQNNTSGSNGSLADTSREVRIAVRKSRIETCRIAKQKPSTDDGSVFLQA